MCMKRKLISSPLLIGSILLLSCKVQHPLPQKKVYKTVQIGTKIWMAENLNTDRFRNGDLIMHASTPEEWVEAGRNKQPAWCHFKNKNKNGVRFGKLYNWYAVMDPRGLAPYGWTVPKDSDWKELSDNLGGDEIAGRKMKSRRGWKRGGNGTNESGFNGLPAGSRSYMLRQGYGIFRNRRESGMWWSATRRDNEVVELAGYCVLGYKEAYLHRGATSLEHGMYVRCLIAKPEVAESYYYFTGRTEKTKRKDKVHPKSNSTF